MSLEYFSPFIFLWTYLTVESILQVEEHILQTKGCLPSVVDEQRQGLHLPQQNVVGPGFFQMKPYLGHLIHLQYQF